MKRLIAIMALSLAPSMLPALTLSEDELIQLAIDRKTCGDMSPASAKYDPPGSTRITVVCEEVTGFVPAFGAAGVGAGAAAAAAGLALAAAGGGGTTVSTPSTN